MKMDQKNPIWDIKKIQNHPMKMVIHLDIELGKNTHLQDPRIIVFGDPTPMLIGHYHLPLHLLLLSYPRPLGGEGDISESMNLVSLEKRRKPVVHDTGPLLRVGPDHIRETDLGWAKGDYQMQDLVKVELEVQCLLDPRSWPLRTKKKRMKMIKGNHPWTKRVKMYSVNGEDGGLMMPHSKEEW
jgi:hypothetical protein